MVFLGNAYLLEVTCHPGPLEPDYGVRFILVTSQQFVVLLRINDGRAFVQTVPILK